MPGDFILSCGSYERFLFGWECKTAGSTDSLELKHKQVLSLAAHRGPVRSLAAGGNYLASGGTDDIVRIFNMSSGKDLGQLVQHEGTVTCLEFVGRHGAGSANPSHLLSAGEDSMLLVWKVGSWAHIASLKGHKRAINAMSAHPSGELCLTVSRDSSLRMWDLGTGKCAAQVALNRARTYEVLQFTAEEATSQYFLGHGRTLDMHSIDRGAKPLHSFAHPSKLLCLAQGPGDLVVTGSEMGAVHGWDSSSGKEAFTIPEAHSARIRGAAICPLEAAPSGILATGCSDGVVKFWDLRMASAGGGWRPLAEHDTSARFTCMAFAKPPRPAASASTGAGEGERAAPGAQQKQKPKEGKQKRPQAPAAGQKAAAADLNTKPKKKQKK